MSEPHISGQVVIVGGGVAGLEALIALRALTGDRLTVTLVSEGDAFVDRPLTVTEPFALGVAARHPLAEIAADFDAAFVQSAVVSVAADEQRVRCDTGPDLGFDTLILAPGARTESPFADAVTFGVPGSNAAFKDLLNGLVGGAARSAAFVAPSTAGWLLPLYELALMTARELALRGTTGVELRVVTPEDRPLSLFGDHASESVALLLKTARIEFIGGASPTVQAGAFAPAADGEWVPVDCVVTLPLLRGPSLPGVPATPRDGFIPVDEFGQVKGLAGAYAAGDAVDFPVKQGGLAAQLADTVAAHIAARYGAPVDVEPFRPTLRGMLLTGDVPRFLRSDVPGADPSVGDAWFPLWWPPTKIAGRHLAPYLFGRSDVEFTTPAAPFIDLDIPLAAATLPG